MIATSSRSSFEALFGKRPDVDAQAPGRVNLMGEHTDYNGGFVLPMALELDTRVRLSVRGDDLVRVYSAMPSTDVLSYRLGQEKKTGTFLDYVQGVTSALRERGHVLQGFDGYLASSVPIGSGLSSSAALTVAFLRALRSAFGLVLDDLAIARVGRAAETDFVGAPVGIMDPMACSLGDTSSAIFIDTRSLQFSRVPFPAELDLLVVDSGVAHDHATGSYAVRKQETERAANLLGLISLRDVTAVDAPAVRLLPEPLQRRVRHVVTENRRTVETARALRERRIGDLRALFAASHASMRDDYEVSVPAVDRVVEAAMAQPGVVGARLTGGGFGGAVVILTHAGQAEEAGRAIVAAAPGARVLVPALPEVH